jgi:hypothetical protein
VAGGLGVTVEEILTDERPALMSPPTSIPTPFAWPDWDFVSAAGRDLAQGYVIAKPMQGGSGLAGWRIGTAIAATLRQPCQ